MLIPSLALITILFLLLVWATIRERVMAKEIKLAKQYYDAIWNNDHDYCILIDCGEYTVLASEIVRIQKTVKYVFLTHGHFDHICGLNQLIHYYPDCLIFTTDYGHRELRNPRKNLSIFQGKAFTICSYKASFLRGGEQLKFTGFPEIEVIATPGHDASCLSYKVDNALFTGDSYIPGL